MTELSELMKAGDNELIAAQNVTALLERGGIDKAIWMLPIDAAAAVIKELYLQRDACKQIIYEITGISDIMRSASDPNETFGAQKIKTQWGTQRLQRMQREVQRYIRDLIRLKAEIISEKFQPETLEAMTLVQLPHQADVDAQKQQVAMQYQQAAQQAQMQGQPPPAQPPQQPDPITWEAVVDAMRNDATRTYRIDIETDSTLSATQDSDMQGLKDLMAGLSGLMQAFGPAIQQGAMDVGMLKELMLVACRRARMGTAVEDVIAKIQQPKPQPDPEAGKAQVMMQLEQAKSQAQMQLEQSKGQIAIQIAQGQAQLKDQQHQRETVSKDTYEQRKAELQAKLQAHEQEVQAQQNQHQNELEAAREVQKAELTAQLAVQKQVHDAALESKRLEFDQWKIEFVESAKIVAAQVSAKSSMDQALLSATQAADQTVAAGDGKDNMKPLLDMHGKTLEAITGVMQQLAKPKKLVRGPDGKATGVE